MATNNAINSSFPVLPIAATLGGTGVPSPTAHSLPIAEGASAFSFVTLTNGQILIGLTGGDPTANTLTAGAGVSIVNGGGTISIAATGHLPYTEVTTTSQTLVSNNEYTANNASLVTLTLPVTAAIGDVIIINGKGAGGWTIAQNAGQLIHAGTSTTTTGVSGSISSIDQYDNLYLKCITANTTWTWQAPNGNFTIV